MIASVARFVHRSSEMEPTIDDRCMRGTPPVVREDGTVEIPLTQGQRALVSAEDYHLVRDQKWTACYFRRIRSYYALDVSKYLPKITMHGVIMGPIPKGHVIDHINHDTLDNRRHMLRVATAAQNTANRRASPGGASKFKGVTWNKASKKWRAYITANGVHSYLGLFQTEQEAADAYDAAAIAAFGEFACTNASGGAIAADAKGPNQATVRFTVSKEYYAELQRDAEAEGRSLKNYLLYTVGQYRRRKQ